MMNEHDAGKEFSGRFKEEFKNARDAVKKPNILVLGGTGAGKSSLVNSVFGEKLAAVSAGKPVTKGIKKYENDLVRVYDSEGYESGQENQSQFMGRIVSFATDKSESLESQVHLVWYCMSYSSHRVLDIDVDIINKIRETTPVAVVFTHADLVSDSDANDMSKAVRARCQGLELFEVSTDQALELGSEPLIEWAYDNLEGALSNAFAAGVRGGIPQKRKESAKIISQHCVAAAGAAASPIPFSDAPMLMGNQAAMIARLAHVWNLPGVETVFAGSAFLGIVSQLGRSVVGNIAKFFPGVGQVVGGAINATVATSMTAAIGWAICELSEKVINANLEGKSVELEDYFNTEMLQEAISKNYKKEMADAKV